MEVYGCWTWSPDLWRALGHRWYRDVIVQALPMTLVRRPLCLNSGERRKNKNLDYLDSIFL